MPIENNVKKILGARPLGQTEESSGRQPTTRLDYTDTKRQQNGGLTKSKIIKSGSLIETYNYEKPVRYGHKTSTNKKNSVGTKNLQRAFEYANKTIYRAVNTLRRLIFANFTENDKFITLTFNNEQDFDINDLDECLIRYQKFMRKLRAKYKFLKYLTVPEFQKRGAVHYHILCNLPYITQSELQKLWPYGFSKINAVKSTTHLALYLVKYLSKKFDDPRKFGHRLYPDVLLKRTHW